MDDILTGKYADQVKTHIFVLKSFTPNMWFKYLFKVNNKVISITSIVIVLVSLWYAMNMSTAKIAER